MNTVGEWWMWIVFVAFVLLMLLVDLYLCGGRKAHRVSVKEALAWTSVWIALAFIFNFLLWLYLKHTISHEVANERALEFFSGYLIEKFLSIDNIFVFVMIFSYFSIPAEYQHRVLVYGVIGAVVLRFIMILCGVWVISQFYWMLYVFGFFLLALGIKMLLFSNQHKDLQKNLLLNVMKKYLRVTDTLVQEKFLVKKDKLTYVTPLFLVLVLVEVTDLIFAVDSIPAIFAVTSDPFIIFTSNIFAILGLRALYFLLSNLSEKFEYLKYGLSLILIFVGIKLLIGHWIKVPIAFTLSLVFLTLLSCVLLSIYRGRLTKIKKST